MESRHQNLGEVLPPTSVALDLVISSKSAAIAQAAKMLEAVAGASAAAIEAALLAREAIGSTGVGAGIALPHARMHQLTHSHTVFLRLAAPIPFESMDGRTIDLLCAVIAPDEPNSAMLEVVGAMAGVLRNADKAAALRSADDPNEARALLISQESEV